MTRRRSILVLVTGAIVAATTALVTAPARVDAAPPEHRLYMITDSVGLGAQWAIPRAFPADWRVTIDGDPGEFVETLEAKLVRPRIAADPGAFGDHAVVAAGYNYPYWDPDRFDRSIDSMVATLTAAGVQHVYWVTLREVKPQYISGAAWRQIQPYFWYFPTVNEHLERALERHPNLTLIDWAAVADRSGITYDAIHLNNDGAALYAALTRSTVMTTVTTVADGSTTRVPIPDPEGVTAVAVNLTTTQPRHRGFLTAYDCDRPRPDVSNHNYVRNQTVAHSTIVPVGPSGEICVDASSSTNLIVDVTGRFTADLSTGASERLVDTRLDGDRRPQPPFDPIEVDVGTLDTTAFTITAIGATERSWVRVAPCEDDAETSNVNMNGPDPVPNAAVARPGPDGVVCVVTSTTAHVILDRLAAFPDDALVEAEAARRVADTRRTTPLVGGGTLRLTAAELDIEASSGDPGTGAAGVLLNVTATRTTERGFVTAFGCDLGEPDTSSLNVAPGTVVANFVIVAPDDDGEICLRTTAATDLIVDVQGRIGDGFVGVPERLLDTRA